MDTHPIVQMPSLNTQAVDRSNLPQYRTNCQPQRSKVLARIFHQGHVRVGCDAVRWQGETTLRARAREKEQRRQHAAARLNRACSAWYKLGLAFEAKKVSIHAVLRGIRERPGEISGLDASPDYLKRHHAQT
jgi:hypothetical protein